jgi:arsenate reductase
MKILFLCVENAGRSQMAEAFARRLAPPGLEVFSAGSRPAKEVHPVVAEALREVGLDICRHRPKGLDALPAGEFDLVVGMGCGDACAVVPAKRTIAWEIANPKDQPLEAVRRIRDEIEANVRELLKELA